MGKKQTLYKQAMYYIIDKITSGEWGTNKKIPSETVLCKQLGMSRMTLNRALNELHYNGVLVRVQGVGTFVASPKGEKTMFEVRNIVSEITKSGAKHKAEVIALKSIKGSDMVCYALDIPLGSKIFYSKIIHFADDLPICVIYRYVNPEIAPDYLKQDFTKEVSNVYLTKVAPVSNTEHIMEAILPDDNLQKDLRIEANVPCFLLKRRTWSGKTRVSYNNLYYAGNRYRLTGSFVIASSKMTPTDDCPLSINISEDDKNGTMTTTG
ncbi:MAG: histidine utilization repressor [Desulfobacter sp.]